jgi:hypothetical protein
LSKCIDFNNDITQKNIGYIDFSDDIKNNIWRNHIVAMKQKIINDITQNNIGYINFSDHITKNNF